MFLRMQNFRDILDIHLIPAESVFFYKNGNPNFCLFIRDFQLFPRTFW